MKLGARIRGMTEDLLPRIRINQHEVTMLGLLQRRLALEK